MSKTKPKMIFNRNKKQLKNIFNERIDELVERFNDLGEGGWLTDNGKIWGRQISLLHWVLEVINNPKKWDCIEIDENLMDESVFTQEVE
tara:strand:+ start:637 stop:903 length:267 start_codon:yes stop_codon:yes gene_type:complete